MIELTHRLPTTHKNHRIVKEISQANSSSRRQNTLPCGTTLTPNVSTHVRNTSISKKPDAQTTTLSGWYSKLIATCTQTQELQKKQHVSYKQFRTAYFPTRSSTPLLPLHLSYSFFNSLASSRSLASRIFSATCPHLDSFCLPVAVAVGQLPT